MANQWRTKPNLPRLPLAMPRGGKLPLGMLTGRSTRSSMRSIRILLDECIPLRPSNAPSRQKFLANDAVRSLCRILYRALTLPPRFSAQDFRIPASQGAAACLTDKDIPFAAFASFPPQKPATSADHGFMCTRAWCGVPPPFPRPPPHNPRPSTSDLDPRKILSTFPFESSVGFSVSIPTFKGNLL